MRTAAAALDLAFDRDGSAAISDSFAGGTRVRLGAPAYSR
jgi:hypothetical protein